MLQKRGVSGDGRIVTVTTRYVTLMKHVVCQPNAVHRMTRSLLTVVSKDRCLLLTTTRDNGTK